MEIYNIKNEINILKGKETIDLDAFRNTNDFYREVAGNKVYELEHRLEGLRRELENTKVRMAQKAVADAFYATEEGQVFKANIEAKIEKVRDQWGELENETIRTIEEQLQHCLGVHWGVGMFRDTHLEIGILSNKPDRKFIFGQTADIYCSLDCWNKKMRFDINFGTCGSTDLLGGNTEGERSRFYIGIGQLFANLDLCEWIKQTMVDAKQQMDVLYEEIDSLQSKLQNPVSE